MDKLIQVDHGDPARDVVDRVIELVDATGELLAYEGLKDLVRSLAEAIGFEDQLIEMLSKIEGFIARIVAGLERLKEPLRHLDALAGLMNLLRPLVGAIGEVLTSTMSQIAASAEDLNDLVVPESVSGALVTAESAVASVGNYLDEQPPTEEQLDLLISELTELSADLVDLGNFEEEGS